MVISGRSFAWRDLKGQSAFKMSQVFSDLLFEKVFPGVVLKINHANRQGRSLLRQKIIQNKIWYIVFEFFLCLVKCCQGIPFSYSLCCSSPYIGCCL